MIEFKNMEAVRAGQAIQELRERNYLSREEFALSTGISSDYLTLLEEGHEDKIPEEVIENILTAANVCFRLTGDKPVDLKRLLLSVTRPLPPVKLR